MALSQMRCIVVLSFDYRRTTTLILNLVLKKVILLKLAMNSATKVCLMQSRQVPHFSNAISDNCTLSICAGDWRLRLSVSLSHSCGGEW